MNTISTIGQTGAMDGTTVSSSFETTKNIKLRTDSMNKLPDSAAEVSENISRNIEATKADVQELQRLSDMVMGHKLQFNVNEDLNKVIVRVVNSKTNEVIREIPSEEVQKFQSRLKRQIGLLFDEVI
ncbi:flagellar protein FlaG [Treponema sp.]|jgi:flagellar protein FlaG|uniref:flagellar protein FlaG n=1 Tax=Treponema sp. TaxID=166 RepID=UPI001AFEF311|nr:flagellar protein FlaG [Treponema sp.]MBE6354132.1 flagellar protein FlaG [Treponema sp.]MBO6176421.1 flagellar protein FlaG [Treponema sp.]